MRKVSFILILSFWLPALFACQKLPTGPDDIPDTQYEPRTELGRMVAEAASVGHIYADTSFVIAQGVDETDIHLQDRKSVV